MAQPVLDALRERFQQRPLLQQQNPRSPLVAQALMASGMSGEPVDSFWESAGQLAQLWAGNKIQGEITAEEEAAAQAQQDELAEIMAGMNLDPAQAQLIGQLDPDAQIEALLPLFGSTEPEGTDDITEYQYAVQQGFQGTFAEWQMMRPPSTQTTVNVGPTGIDYGNPPTNHAWQRDAQGNIMTDERGVPVALPVGPALAEQQAAEEQAEARRAAFNSDAQNVLRTIDDALGMAAGGNVGFWGGLFGNFEVGTPQYELNQLLGTVATNIGINEIQSMRDLSPTGGAVGQVTIPEWERFERAIASLRQGLPEDRLRENLYEVKATFLDLVHGAGNWFYSGDGTIMLRVPDGTEMPWTAERPADQIPPELRPAPAAPQEPAYGPQPNPALTPDAEGWITLPDGTRIRPMPQ